MPKDDRTPQIFENRNGRSFVRTVSSHSEPFRSSQLWIAPGPRTLARRTWP